MLCLAYDTSPEETREADENDSWDRGDSDRNPTGFKLVRCKSVPGNGMDEYEVFDEEDPGGNFLWAVWIVYSDGDTFGSTSGYVDAFWVGTDEAQAEVMKERASSKDHGYFAHTESVRCEHMPVHTVK